MKVSVTKSLAAAVMSIACIAQFASSAFCQGYLFGQSSLSYNPYYNYSPYINSYTNPYANQSVFTTHPILSATLLGTAIGATGGVAIGALQKKDSQGSGALGVDTALGAGAGAALGAGIGIIRNKQLYGSYF